MSTNQSKLTSAMQTPPTGGQIQALNNLLVDSNRTQSSVYMNMWLRTRNREIGNDDFTVLGQQTTGTIPVRLGDSESIRMSNWLRQNRHILSSYGNKWVAIVNYEIVAAENTPIKLTRLLIRKNIKKPFITWVEKQKSQGRKSFFSKND